MGAKRRDADVCFGYESAARFFVIELFANAVSNLDELKY